MRGLIIAVLALVLVACGGSPEAAAPTPTPLVVTQLVTQVVTQIVVQKETVVVTVTPRPATPTPKATPTPSPPPAGGKWKVDESTSSFDDSKTVVLTLEADGEITGPIGSVRPALILRCQEKATEVYVHVGMQPDVEGVSDTATVRLRFDSEEARTLQALKSTSGESLFLEPPQELIESMLAHEQMVFEFTPFSASPAEMTFDLHGLGDVIGTLREACP